MQELDFDTVVIGGGPAGILASIRSAQRGNRTLLAERNKTLGKKLLITAKGRCNITNDTDIQGLVDNIPGNGNFLYSSFHTFSNKDLISLLNSNGLETKAERGGRVFPASDRAKDVLDTLVRICRESGVAVKTGLRIMRLAVNDGRITGAVSDSGMDIRCNSVILATGGLSYPSTGSTGDGYRMVKELGHSIIQPRASLVPLNTEEKYVSQMQGLTLKNVSVIFRNSTGKIIYSDFGELLFTHYGVSGPVILSGSRHLADYGYAGASISIDMKPALTHEQLDGRIVRDFMKFSRKNFKNSLNELLPQKMIPVIVKLSGIPGDKPVNQVTKTERLSLVSLLKDFRLHVTGPRPIEEAVVTAGGIAVNEVEPATMQSKIVKGLYFAGEILDVDGYTGGFNLTIAFSTGYTAGNSC